MNGKVQLQVAIENHARFPESVIDESLYEHVASNYVKLLDQQSERIFGSESHMKLEILDYTEADKGKQCGFMSSMITKNADMDKIGDPSLEKLDPRCRFIFVHAPNSRAKLYVTRSTMLYAFTYHQIMPAYLDFLTPFGQQSEARDFHFSGLRYEIRLSATTPGLQIGELGRSGKDFRMCYNLKSVEPYERQPRSPWSIRQAAIYHSFDVDQGRAFWTIVKGDELIKKRIKTTPRFETNSMNYAAICFKESLVAHLIIFAWCAENWRWYLNFLEEETRAGTAEALLHRFDRPASQYAPKPKSPEPEMGIFKKLTHRIMSATNTLVPNVPSQVSISRKEPQPEFEPDPQSEATFTFSHLQNLSHYEEKTNDVISILSSNIKILKNVSSCYTRILDSPDFPSHIKTESAEEVSKFQEMTNNHVEDLEIQLDRAKAILFVLSNRKGLLNGVLEYRNMEASKLASQKSALSTRRMESMTMEMHALAKQAKRQAGSMHVITVVTLIFLPGTFISTIMSTDIIKFPKDDATNSFKRNFSSSALTLYLSITIPLMFVTLFGWFCVYWCTNRRQAARDARSEIEKMTGPRKEVV